MLSKMVRSMTGFGVSEGPVAGGTLKIEIRTVNHRHFNTQIKTCAELSPLEVDVKTALRERIERGHVSFSARWTDGPGKTRILELDVDRAREILDVVRRLREEVDVEGDVDLAFLVRQPDVLIQGKAEETSVSMGDVEPLLSIVLDAVIAMREQEGEALEKELQRILGRLEGNLEGVKDGAQDRLPRERDRLKESVRELLDGAEIDEGRLAQEIAILSDKLDVTEEIVRLGTHIGACRKAMSGDGAIGRKLSFLGQEMLREINTIGSKANDVHLTTLVIDMKGDLEKFREQVENVE